MGTLSPYRYLAGLLLCSNALLADTFVVDDDFNGVNPATACEQPADPTTTFFDRPEDAVDAAANVPAGAGHLIRVCPGNYDIQGRRIRFNDNNHVDLTFEGTSGNAADVVITANNNRDIIDIQEPRIIVRHLTLDGGNRGLTTTDDFADGILNNLIITNSGNTGVRLRGPRAQVSNITISTSDRAGFQSTDTASDVTLTDITVNDAGRQGILVDSPRISISNALVSNSNQEGLRIGNDSDDSTFSDITVNTTIGGNRECIESQNGADRIRIEGANLSNCSGDGLRMNSLDSFFSELIIDNPGQDCIELRDMRYQLLDSRLSNCGDNGILLSRDASNGLIQRNRVNDVGGIGLFVEDDNRDNDLNRIFENCFENNTNITDDEVDGVINVYNQGGRGNYYANPAGINDVAGCVDLNTDNVCDDPTVFNIPGAAGAVDNDPLFQCQLLIPLLTVSKTVSVISDPVNGTTNPKAIPDALVRYRIEVMNATGLSIGEAESVIISDDLDNQITTQGEFSWSPNSMVITTPTINGGVATPLSDNADADAGSFNDTPGNRQINANCGDLQAGQRCQLDYDVIIQ